MRRSFLIMLERILLPAEWSFYIQEINEETNISQDALNLEALPGM